MKTVVVVCAGGRRHPHPSKLALVARFQSVLYGTEAEGYVEQWDEADIETRQYRAEMDQALAESPYWLPPPPDVPGPRQVVTQWITEGGVPVPDHIEGGTEGLAFWNRQPSYRKFRLACPHPKCTLDVQLHQDKLFPALTATDTPEDGESRLLLRDLC